MTTDYTIATDCKCDGCRCTVKRGFVMNLRDDGKQTTLCVDCKRLFDFGQRWMVGPLAANIWDGDIGCDGVNA